MGNNYIPFVYQITLLNTGLKYIGSKYAAGSHPDQLLTEYFTSSSLISKLLEKEIENKNTIKIDWIEEYPDDPNTALKNEICYLKSIKKNGLENDYANMNFCSGDNLTLEVSSKGGKVGGYKSYINKTGIFGASQEQKLEWCSQGGHFGAKSQMEQKIGIHGQTIEERRELGRKAGKVGAFTNSDVQSELGKRGGPKNKGFKWYTDGINGFKYTPKMQEEKSFEQFLKENPEFSKGRPVKKEEGKNEGN